MRIEPEQDLMRVNDEYAARNRALFAAHSLLALNILGSPGAGKTSLLEAMIPLFPPTLRLAVIEGDLATAKDAQRIRQLGVEVVQINTDGGCHLDAKMIHRVLPLFDLAKADLLLIENVGNLVCPAGFDLGEDARLVVLSIAEGGDKPSKYPATFISADLVALNKLDLAPYVDIDLEAVSRDIQTLKPGMPVFNTACRRGSEQGLDSLAQHLLDLLAAKRGGQA